MTTTTLARLLQALGLFILLMGSASALLGPVELYSFYLFSEGGRFYYKGFGFGSFLFGFIAVQIVGYYVIGALLIPLGYGHLRLRPWARRLALALSWCWLVLGVPLLVVIAFTVFSFKELPVPAALALLVGLALTYPLLPLLLIRVYLGARVRDAFLIRGGREGATWVERLPMPVLVLAILIAFYAIVLHFPILFNGLFPLFGAWLTGLPGIVVLTAAIASAIVLVWGLVDRRRWAWWLSLVGVAAMAADIVVTLWLTGFAELLALARFPPAEVAILGGVPLQGYHLAAFLALPLIGTLGVILAARRCLARRSDESLAGLPMEHAGAVTSTRSQP